MAMECDYLIRCFCFLPDISKMAHGSLTCRSHGERNMEVQYIVL